MSEYQYYEFQAIDQPIDKDGMDELRRVSSRAEITPTSFVNEYNFGDFKGSPYRFMQRWFDFHLYVASWGTRRLMIRLPDKFVDLAQFEPFLRGCELVNINSSKNNIIVEFSDPDEEGQYSGWEEGSGWLSQLVPLRSDLLSGDYRILYIAWLWAVDVGHIRDEAKEPLPGIAPLTGPLSSFAEFFRINPDLVSAAAERPVNITDDSNSKESAHAVVSKLSDSEKTSMLCRLADGDPLVQIEIRRRIRDAAVTGFKPQKLRTAAELRERTKEVRLERRLAENMRREAEHKRRRQEEKRLRLERIAQVAEMGEKAWDEVEVHLRIKSGRSYDAAAQQLRDLKTVADENGTVDQFFVRLDSIRRKHANRPKFIERLESIRR